MSESDLGAPDLATGVRSEDSRPPGKSPLVGGQVPVCTREVPRELDPPLPAPESLCTGRCPGRALSHQKARPVGMSSPGGFAWPPC